MNDGLKRQALWWKHDEDFKRRLIDAVEAGETPKSFLDKHFPEVNPSTVNKYLNNDPTIRKVYENAKNRFLLRLEYDFIRTEAKEEAEISGESFDDICKRWGVYCDFSVYRVGETGNPKWRTQKRSKGEESEIYGLKV